VRELPAGWVTAPIGSLCFLENGRAFKPTEWTDTGIPIVRIQNLNNQNAAFNYFDGEYGDRYHLDGGELLFAWSGTPGTSFGAHIWRGGQAVLNQHIFRVDFDENTLDKRFFRYAINQKLEELINIAHGGVGLRHVTKGKFERTEVALPPLNEQKRIADKLDILLARVDACREHLDHVPLILKRFRQSVLAAATSGQLTEDWRVKEGLEIDVSSLWDEMALLDTCQPGRIITYGVIKLGAEVPDGVPCLRTSNVRWLKIDTQGMKRIAANLSAEYSRTVLEGTEVLVNVRGTLGGVAAVTPDMAGWNVSREVAVIPVDTIKVNQTFLTYWIGSEVSQRWLHGVEKGVAYIGINIEDLRTLSVKLPSLDEQHEIVRRVETLFAFADRLETRLTTARNHADRLTPATLAKAFRGELVPQDPNDEPASVLLERIRAARQSRAGISSTFVKRKLRIKTEVNKKSEVAMLELSQIQPDHFTVILKEKGRMTAKALYQISQLSIEDFYEQLRTEEAQKLLCEIREGNESYLEAL
jgi:type I restriction enzyme, S subunit